MVLEGLTWQKGGKTRRFSPSRELPVLTCDWRIRGAGVPFYKGQSLRPCAERHAISVSGAQERARVGPVPREFTRRRGEKNLDGWIWRGIVSVSRYVHSTRYRYSSLLCDFIYRNKRRKFVMSWWWMFSKDLSGKFDREVADKSLQNKKKIY